jgi:hypothetical protein
LKEGTWTVFADPTFFFLGASLEQLNSVQHNNRMNMFFIVSLFLFVLLNLLALNKDVRLSKNSPA